MERSGRALLPTPVLPLVLPRTLHDQSHRAASTITPSPCEVIQSRPAPAGAAAFTRITLDDTMYFVSPEEGASKPHWAEMLQTISQLPLKESTREAIQGQSVCLGASSKGGGQRSPTVTAITMSNQSLVASIVRLIRSLPGFDPAFTFSSVQVGRNTRVAPHRDSANEGPSAAIGLGDYTGGHLVVENKVVCIRHKIFFFNGLRTHHTTPHTGDRVSLIAFTHSGAKELPEEGRQVLIELGFPLQGHRAKRAKNGPLGAADMSATPAVSSTQPWLPSPRAELSGTTGNIAAKLLAAKPVRWAGRGELLQLPWKPEIRGTVLVIDLWSGVSTLLVSLLALGVNCIALCAENAADGEVQRLAARAFPQAVEIQDVEEVHPEMFRPVLQRRQFSAIVVGGGSPCQGNSALNPDRKGLGDKRSWQPLHLDKLANGIQAIAGKVPVLRFLENVAAAPQSVIQEYDKIMGCRSIIIEAQAFGWVQRARRLWGCGPGGRVADLIHPRLPPGVSIDDQAERRIRWEGKPIPLKLRTPDGFRPMIDPGEVVKNGGKGAMFPFTRRFRHPGDKKQGCSKDAVRRYEEADRQFPPAAFEESSLLWRGSEWRMLDGAERALLMGVPPDLVVPQSAVKRRGEMPTQVTAQSALGNAFHVPSMMLFLILLFQCVESGSQPCSAFRYEAAEAALLGRASGTIWEPGALEATQGLLSPAEVVEDMQRMLCQVAPGFSWESLSMSLVNRTHQCNMLQTYWASAQLRGLGSSTNGPQWAAHHSRPNQSAAFGWQRAAGSSSRGLSHLIQPGLGKTQHLAVARELPSPFGQPGPCDDDLDFAANALAVFGPLLPRWREKMRKALRELCKLLRPLEAFLALQAVPSVGGVSRTHGPACMALVTSLLRWPDQDQPAGYVKGFHVLGHMLSSGVYRQSEADPITDAELESGFFGKAAEQFIDDICCSAAPRDAEVIESLVTDEIEKGYQDSGVDVEQMNRRFGKGKWRPLLLFSLQQGQKTRLIADAKRAGHNAWISEDERLMVISIDWVAEAARALLASVQSRWTQQEMETWFDLGLALQDMSDAYRQVPIDPQHQRANVVCWFATGLKKWQFAVVRGMVFGVSSAVLTFNRLPALTIAMARRMFGIVAAAYYDDFVTVSSVSDQASAREALQTCLSAVGGRFGPEKEVTWATQRVALGVHVRLDQAVSQGVVTFEPKQDTLRALQENVAARRYEGKCTPAQAAKLRGHASWAATHTFNMAGRLGIAPLKRRQYHEVTTAITEYLEEGFHFITEILPQIPSRKFSLLAPRLPPVLVYSDASWPSAFDEHSTAVPRLGWVIAVPGEPIRGWSMVLPDKAMATWTKRKTQIFAAEAIVPLIAAHLHGDLLRGRDVVWFVDNEAAVSSLIRGSARPEDVGKLAGAVHVTLINLGCRAWFEWIDSESNIADGLSREGVTDEWTMAQGWILEEASVRSWEELYEKLPNYLIGATSMTPA